MSGTMSRTMSGSTRADHLKTLGCGYCQKQFSNGYSLKKHVIQIHENAGTFRCGYCHRSFLDKSNLAEHMRVHTEERPFRCEVCPSLFKRKYHLKRHHLLIHSGEKSFRNDKCPKAFSSKHHLAHHGPSEAGEQDGEGVKVVDGVFRSSEEDVDRVGKDLVPTANTENWVPDGEVRAFDDGGSEPANQRTIQREHDSDGNDVKMATDLYASNNPLQRIDRMIIDSSDEQAGHQPGHQAGQQVDEPPAESSNVGNPILKLVYDVEYPTELCEPL